MERGGMKNKCDICGKELGMLAMRSKVKDGVVCRDCLLKVGLGDLLINGGKQYTLDDIRNGRRVKEFSKEFKWDLRNKADKEEIYNALNQRNDMFLETKNIRGYLKIDEKNSLFKIVPPNFLNAPDIFDTSYKGKGYYKNAVFSFEELISYEVIENDDVVSKGGYGLAATGAITFGGAAAITGSVLGKKTQGVCRSLKLKLTIDGLSNNVEYLYFITNKTKKSSFIYTDAVNKLQECISALELILNQNHQKLDNTYECYSPADEIRKYKELLDCGAITVEEFETLKRKLLNL